VELWTISRVDRDNFVNNYFIIFNSNVTVDAFSMVKLNAMIGEIDSLVVDKLKFSCLACVALE
jgi:hypothetical protein